MAMLGATSGCARILKISCLASKREKDRKHNSSFKNWWSWWGTITNRWKREEQTSKPATCSTGGFWVLCFTWVPPRHQLLHSHPGLLEIPILRTLRRCDQLPAGPGNARLLCANVGPVLAYIGSIAYTTWLIQYLSISPERFGQELQSKAEATQSDKPLVAHASQHLWSPACGADSKQVPLVDIHCIDHIWMIICHHYDLVYIYI